MLTLPEWITSTRWLPSLRPAPTDASVALAPFASVNSAMWTSRSGDGAIVSTAAAPEATIDGNGAFGFLAGSDPGSPLTVVAPVITRVVPSHVAPLPEA